MCLISIWFPLYVFWFILVPEYTNIYIMYVHNVELCLLVEKVKVLVTLWCPALCNTIGCSLPGSSVPGILQARILGWVAIPLSRGSSWPRGGPQGSHTACQFFTVWVIKEGHLYAELQMSEARSCLLHSILIFKVNIQVNEGIDGWNSGVTQSVNQVASKSTSWQSSSTISDSKTSWAL